MALYSLVSGCDTKAYIGKGLFLRVYNFDALKDAVSKVKAQLIEWEKVLQMLSNKGFILTPGTQIHVCTCRRHQEGFVLTDKCSRKQEC